jgi:hypothetical protein
VAKKEVIQSLVVTKNAEFKHKSVQMLNNIAFAAEKHTADGVVDAESMIAGNKQIGNIVLDATDKVASYAILNDGALIGTLQEKPDIHALFYASPEALGPLKESRLGALNNVLIAALPIDRKHFMEVFHTRRKAPPVPVQINAAPSRPKLDEDLKAAAVDAAGHLKTVVAHINGVNADPARLDLLAEVGQRYNGIMGTFAFFGTAPGAAELTDIGNIVDAIARSYSKNPGWLRITDSHLRLLSSCCKATVPILRQFILGEAIPREVDLAVNAARTEFSRDTTLIKRQGISQAKIDSALAKQDAKAEEMRQAFFETSAHLKEAIVHLNAVLKDPARLDALAEVGQLFNGVFGTFAFYQDRMGSTNLIAVSAVIDDLCRSYAKSDKKQVAAEHVNLLKEAAEACLLILKDLREGKPPQDARRAAIDKLVERAKNDETIQQRRNVSQDDVDRLLEDLAAA